MPDPTLVSLRPISAETVRQVTRLAVRSKQQRFVASNAISLAEALFAPEAWYRAVFYGESMAGFVMLFDESLRVPMPKAPKVDLWRFMIDAKFQARGIGRTAIEQVIAHVRDKALFSSLATSYVPGPGCPEKFYLGLGFRPTGEVDHGEIVLRLAIHQDVT